MSIVVEMFPICDVCGESFCDYRDYLRNHPRMWRLRDMMKRDGWRQQTVRGDICPDCVADEESKGASDESREPKPSKETT